MKTIPLAPMPKGAVPIPKSDERQHRPLDIGTRVVLTGLMTTGVLKNGKKGVVKVASTPKELERVKQYPDRCLVLLDSGDKVLILPECVTPITQADQDVRPAIISLYSPFSPTKTTGSALPPIFNKTRHMAGADRLSIEETEE